MNEKIEQIEMEVLTPIFIGGNESKNLKKLDYIYEDNKINIINQEKLLNYLEDKKLYDSFFKLLKSGSKKFSISDFFRENNLIDYRTRIYKESIDITGYNKNTVNEINRFVSDGYSKKYIPGSSLKGMIVNAIKCKYMNDHNFEMRGLRELDQLRGRDFDRELSSKSRDIEKILIDEDNKLAQYIQVSDSKVIDDKSTFFGVKEDLVLKAKEVKINSISLCREYLKPGIKVQFSIKVQYDKLNKLGIYSFEDIVKALEFKTNDVIKMQSKIVESAQKCNIKVRYSNNNDTPNAILGGGAGYFSKSALYNSSKDKQMIYRLVAKQLDNKFRHSHLKNDIFVSPRTVKLSSYNNVKYVVGMCKVIKK